MGAWSYCHLFVSDVNQGNGDFGCKKVGSRFFCVAPRTFLRISPGNCSKERDLEVVISKCCLW